MSRLRGAALAIVLVLSSCNSRGMQLTAEGILNQGTVGWPKHQRTIPTPLETRSSVPEKDVLLMFPEIDQRHVLHWSALENIRLVLPKTPAALESRVPSGIALGDLRTTDRTIEEGTYELILCAFGRTWDGRKYSPKEFLAPSYCADGDPRGPRKATIGLVDSTLEELRQHAARAGVFVVRDVRCYLASDPRRLWCEGTAERPPG